jgi:hypothetical protein
VDLDHSSFSLISLKNQPLWLLCKLFFARFLCLFFFFSSRLARNQALLPNYALGSSCTSSLFNYRSIAFLDSMFFLFLFSRPYTNAQIVTSLRSRAAVDLAVEDIYQQNLLPGFHFDFCFYDTAGMLFFCPPSLFSKMVIFSRRLHTTSRKSRSGTDHQSHLRQWHKTSVSLFLFACVFRVFICLFLVCRF